MTGNQHGSGGYRLGEAETVAALADIA